MHSQYYAFVICCLLNAIMVYFQMTVMESMLDWGVLRGIFYMVFYALGSILFPALQRIYEGLQREGMSKKRLIFLILYTAVTIYMVLLWFYGVHIGIGMLSGYIRSYMVQIIIPLVMSIWLIISCFFIPASPSVIETGKNTMILCGTETMIKNFMGILIGGLNISICGGLKNILFVFVCYVFEYRFIFPYINRHLPWLNGKSK